MAKPRSLVLALMAQAAFGAITIENAELRLVIGEDARVMSLVHKTSRQECLAGPTPAFAAVQHRGSDRPKVTTAKSVRREGDRLIVGFDPLVSIATIQLHITDAYIGFTLKTITGDASFAAGKARPAEFNEETRPFDELFFLQLPVRERAKFGAWLNVAWDESLAVNLLATDPYTRVDSSLGPNGRVMRAAAQPAVRGEGVGAALIVTEPGNLLDRIDRVENDYNLPHGVRGRRAPEARFSYWEISEPLTAANVGPHIQYAKMAGLRLMQLYYRSFAKTVGHFPWRPEYPGGMDDLRTALQRLEQAGITPGLHLHFSKAHIQDAYVTPHPDPRLNLRRRFTVAAGVTAAGTEIPVLENPRNCTLDQGRRLLRVGDEIIEYESYSTEPPYRFSGCRRGVLGTTAVAHAAGTAGGLLDVDNWPVFVRFNQETGIQHEVARRLGEIWRTAGFRFAYFDGSEDVNPPHWFHIPWAQWLVYREFQPEPVFSETSNLAHFNWHMMSRGTAEDPVPPEDLKAFVRRWRIPEAEDRALNFTCIDFGWVRYGYPGAKSMGMQPDIMEYVTSRAAGFGCPISIAATLQHLDATPRTADNLEVIRRWEEVRARGWLTEAQRRELRDPDQEHTLLIDEHGAFELVRWRQVAGTPGTVRAFVFERAGKTYVAFWGARGQSRLALPVSRGSVRLLAELGREAPLEKTAQGVLLPVAGRQYLEWRGVTPAEAAAAFRQSEKR